MTKPSQTHLIPVVRRVTSFMVGMPHFEFAGRSALMRNLDNRFKEGSLVPSDVSIGFETMITDKANPSIQQTMKYFEIGEYDKVMNCLSQVRPSNIANQMQAITEFTDETATRSLMSFCQRNGIEHCQLDPEGLNEYVQAHNKEIFAGDIRSLRNIESIRVKGMLRNASSMNAPINICLVGAMHLPRLVQEYNKHFNTAASEDAKVVPVLLWSNMETTITGMTARDFWQQVQSSSEVKFDPVLLEANCDIGNPDNTRLFVNDDQFDTMVKSAKNYGERGPDNRIAANKARPLAQQKHREV